MAIAYLLLRQRDILGMKSVLSLIPLWFQTFAAYAFASVPNVPMTTQGKALSVLESHVSMNVIVVGGSSGMGKAAARELLVHGGTCLACQPV